MWPDGSDLHCKKYVFLRMYGSSTSGMLLVSNLLIHSALSIGPYETIDGSQIKRSHYAEITYCSSFGRNGHGIADGHSCNALVYLSCRRESALRYQSAEPQSGVSDPHAPATDSGGPVGLNGAGAGLTGTQRYCAVP